MDCLDIKQLPSLSSSRPTFEEYFGLAEEFLVLVKISSTEAHIWQHPNVPDEDLV